MPLALTRRPQPRLLPGFALHSIVILFVAPFLAVLFWGGGEAHSGALIAQLAAFLGALFIYWFPLTVLSISSAVVFVLISRLESRIVQHVLGGVAGASAIFVLRTFREVPADMYIPALASGIIVGLVLPSLWRAPVLYAKEKKISAA